MEKQMLLFENLNLNLKEKKEHIEPKEGKDRLSIQKAMKKEKEEKVYTVQTVESPEIIKIEANLAGLPFFALSRREASTLTEIEYCIKSPESTSLWRVTANSKYGFPTPFDRKVFKAMEYLISQRGFPVKNPFKFSMYELAGALGHGHSGQIYRKLRESLIRIVHTGVDSELMFYNKREQNHISDSFHIYNQIIFKKWTLPDGKAAETNYLFLGNWYLVSLNAFYVKPIDYTYHQRLKSDIAGRLYELAGLKFFGVFMNEGKYWKPSYPELCDLLPITRQAYLSRAKQQLEKPHKELIDTEFFSKVKWEDTDPWYIRYYPGSRAIKEFERHKAMMELPLKALRMGEAELKSADDSLDSLVKLLVDRGISQVKAEELSRNYSDCTEDKCEAFDWIKDYRPELLRTNPPGFLVKMIKEDWAPPEGFMTKAQIEEEKRKEKERIEDIKQQDKEREYQEWVRMTHEQKIAGDLFVWERNLRKEGYEPTPEEIEEKKRQLIANLPTDEEYRQMIFDEE